MPQPDHIIKLELPEDDSKLDADIQAHGGNGAGDLEFQRDKAAAVHFFDLAEVEIRKLWRELYENPDDTMLAAADIALRHNDSLPNAEFIIPEKSPTAKGTGRTPRQAGIKAFPGPGDFVLRDGVGVPR